MKERRNAQPVVVRCKLVLVGDVQCGKTAMLQVIAKDCYPEWGGLRLQRLNDTALLGSLCLAKRFPGVGMSRLPPAFAHARRPFLGQELSELNHHVRLPSRTYVPTVFENYTACLELEEQRVELSLWDTSGKFAAGPRERPRVKVLSRPRGSPGSRSERASWVEGVPRGRGFERGVSSACRRAAGGSRAAVPESATASVCISLASEFLKPLMEPLESTGWFPLGVGLQRFCKLSALRVPSGLVSGLRQSRAAVLTSGLWSCLVLDIPFNDHAVVVGSLGKRCSRGENCPSYERRPALSLRFARDLKPSLCFPGSPYYDNVRPLCYSDSDAVLLCFDVSRPDTIDSALKKWKTEILDFCPSTRILLIGCKTDLRTDVCTLMELSNQKQVPISHEQGSAMAKQLGAEAYLECSAFTSEKSIHSVFRTAALACMNRLQPPAQPSPARRLSKRLLHLPSKSELLTSTFKKEKAKSCSLM
ncbi:RND1 protein, partial [Atractosteus spatula]|nr:RND1 protein [Atractosteus spatula]